jgi:hypothetical protein
MAGRDTAVIRAVLDRHGQTYAEEAGIRLADKPAPLYQLLVLATLLSARISADIAVAAARELFAAGYRTPRRCGRRAGRTGWTRSGAGTIDGTTSAPPRCSATRPSCCWTGGMATCAGFATRRAVIRIGSPSCSPSSPGLGRPAPIFLREVQAVWPKVAPHLGRRVASGAGKLGLPTDDRALAELVPRRELARLAAALTRVSRGGQREIRDTKAAADH